MGILQSIQNIFSGTPKKEQRSINYSLPFGPSQEVSAETALTFSAPYSVNSPIPGNPTLDNETGEITYNSNTAGVFVTCVKVEARKCGQLVGEIYREVQVVLNFIKLY